MFHTKKHSKTHLSVRLDDDKLHIDETKKTRLL